MTHRKISLVVLAAVLAAVLVLTPDVFLIVFAGGLLAVLLRGGGSFIARWLRLPAGAGITIFALVVVGGLAGAAAALTPSVAAQMEELASKLPGAMDEAGEWVRQFPGGDRLLDRVGPRVFNSSEGQSAARSAVTSTFGALGNFLIIIFIGIYGAASPDLYRKGLLALLAPSLRARGQEIVEESGATLRTWLTAQLASMTIVGVLTGVGLWLVGVPLAFLLGLIAGLFAFVPIVGPIAAAIPGLLIAFPEGWSMLFSALVVYVGVQAIESNLVTPLIQQHRVHLPAALVLIVQLFFGAVFGLLGLALATPLAALAMTLTDRIYVDYLDREKSSDS